MYISTVDSNSFLKLKQDQSLNVTFTGFVENLMHLLKESQAGKLVINLVELRSSERASETAVTIGESIETHELQFVESRSFKDLVHLCLPCRTAPVKVVLFYMSNILDEIQVSIL